jgi:type II secretory pathway pseudopilin PulG
MPYCAHCGSSVAQVSFAPCPSCAKPTNGAPATAARQSSTAAVVIGVVVGLVAVLGIVGILASIAIPNFLTAMQRSRQKRSMADIRSIATMLETYRTEKGVYPADPAQAGTIPQQDGWTTPYSIVVTETAYYIGSAGANKSFEKPLPEYTPGVGDNFDCDIIYANGAFVQQPELDGGSR